VKTGETSEEGGEDAGGVGLLVQLVISSEFSEKFIKSSIAKIFSFIFVVFVIVLRVFFDDKFFCLKVDIFLSDGRVTVGILNSIVILVVGVYCGGLFCDIFEIIKKVLVL
jgi:hypothetical protein